jgi:hypothetical protein
MRAAERRVLDRGVPQSDLAERFVTGRVRNGEGVAVSVAQAVMLAFDDGPGCLDGRRRGHRRDQGNQGICRSVLNQCQNAEGGCPSELA